LVAAPPTVAEVKLTNDWQPVEYRTRVLPLSQTAVPNCDLPILSIATSRFVGGAKVFRYQK